MHLNYSRSPTPKLSTFNGNGEATEIEFGEPIPDDDYSLYLILTSAETVDVFHDSRAKRALIRYIYTGELQSDVALPLLPLAHRFQLEDLIAECCKQMLESLSTATVARTVKALRALQGQGQMAQIWEEALDTVLGDRVLSRAALETM